MFVVLRVALIICLICSLTEIFPRYLILGDVIFVVLQVAV